MNRIERLEKSHAEYWEGKETTLSDVEYDKEIEWLRKTHPDHPLLNSLGGEKTQGKVKHETPMLSLSKAYRFEEIKKFIEKTARTPDERFVAQAKFDGIAAHFEKDILSTRGDGEYGEDISRHIKSIRLISNGISTPLKNANRSVLGELVCSFETFREHGGEFKHPRNFVIGMIGRKESIPPGIKIDFVDYSSSPAVQFKARDFNESMQKSILDFFEQYDLFPKDGIVFKLVDKKYSASLGNTSHHPLGQIAYKFLGERAESRLLSVDWQAGKNRLTPVGNIEPVELGGVTVSRVTLHNYKLVKDWNLHIGDDLVIERAGDVIPHILTAKKGPKSSKAIMIYACPYCNSKLKYEEVEVRCTNELCGGKTFARLAHAIKELQVENIGDVALQQIIDKFKFRFISQFFSLKKEDFESCGIGPKKSEKIFQSFKERRINEPERIFSTIPIEGIGRQTWKEIMKNFPLRTLLEERLEMNDLMSIKGIDYITMKKIRQGIAFYREELKALFQIISLKKEDSKESKGTICFTGKMPQKRSYYEKLASDNGYVPVDSVTKDLTLLICASGDSNSSKAQNARRLGVKTMELDEWLKGIENA